MPFLKRLAVRCYRSIQKADLRLGEITVVVGESDTGKSNLVRAIRDWAYIATGYDMISLGHTACRVALVLGDNMKVVWERATPENGGHSTGATQEKVGKKFVVTRQGGGTMRYVVAGPKHPKPLSYERLGTTVPPELIDVTGFRRLKIDDVLVQLNVAEQKDPWFLLVSPPWTPGKTTKVIGTVSGVDALILANRDVAKEKQVETMKVSQYTNELAEIDGELLGFAGLDQATALSAQAAERLAQVQADQKTLDTAANLLRMIANLRQRAKRATELAEVFKRAVDAAAGCEVLDQIDRLANAHDLLRNAEIKQAAVVRSTEALRRAHEALEAAKAELVAAATGNDLECPLCQQGIHDDCRQAILDESKEIT